MAYNCKVITLELYRLFSTSNFCSEYFYQLNAFEIYSKVSKKKNYTRKRVTFTLRIHLVISHSNLIISHQGLSHSHTSRLWSRHRRHRCWTFEERLYRAT